MLQNWVGNGIGSESDFLTSSRIRSVNLVIFWKQDGKSSSISKDQKEMIEIEKLFLKPRTVIFNKDR